MDLLWAGIRSIRRRGLRGTTEVGAKAAFYELAERFNLYRGASLMEEKWDCLIVLDACRVDALQVVANEYDFLPDIIPSRCSVGSASDVWLKRTFDDKFQEEMGKTVHVTANPNSRQYLAPEEFLHLDEVWIKHFDSDLGTTPPRPVTDYAIDRWRRYRPTRLIVHYIQPHFPSIPDPLGFGIEKGAVDPDKHEWIWRGGKPEGYSTERIWRAYIANLHHVLKDVELLLNSIDCPSVIISADHGNAYGEWGEWGHPDKPLPILRKVPDVRTSATDTNSYTPKTDLATPPTEGDVEEVLSALGYIDE